MKAKFILSVTFLFLLFTANSTVAQNTFNFDIKNMANDSCMVGYYLGNTQYVFGDDGNNQMIYIDANGKGIITRDDFKMGMMLLVFPPNNEYVDFVFDGKNLTFNLDRNDINNSIEINSLSNKLLKEQNLLILKLTKTHQNLTQQKEENPELDIESDLQNISKEFILFQEYAIENYPDNLFAKILKARQEVSIPESITVEKQQYIYYKSHYFDNIDFNNEWLNRTQFFYPKIETYIEQLTIQNPESIIKSIDEVLEYMDEKSELYKFYVVTFLNKYAKGTDSNSTIIYRHIVKAYYISGKAIWASEEQLKKIIDSYNKMNE